MTQAMVEILLVEDNELDVELTLRALQEERLGNKIHVARDGQEALDYLAITENGAEATEVTFPKLILLDLKLPRIDGHEVLRRIKSNAATKMIPVVVLTSSRENEDMIRSYVSGVNSYIQKPINFERFRTIVKDLGLYWLVVNQTPSTGAARATAR